MSAWAPLQILRKYFVLTSEIIPKGNFSSKGERFSFIMMILLFLYPWKIVGRVLKKIVTVSELACDTLPTLHNHV